MCPDTFTLLTMKLILDMKIQVQTLDKYSVFSTIFKTVKIFIIIIIIFLEENRREKRKCLRFIFQHAFKYNIGNIVPRNYRIRNSI